MKNPFILISFILLLMVFVLTNCVRQKEQYIQQLETSQHKDTISITEYRDTGHVELIHDTIPIPEIIYIPRVDLNFLSVIERLEQENDSLKGLTSTLEDALSIREYSDTTELEDGLYFDKLKVKGKVLGWARSYQSFNRTRIIETNLPGESQKRKRYFGLYLQPSIRQGIFDEFNVGGIYLDKEGYFVLGEYGVRYSTISLGVGKFFKY